MRRPTFFVRPAIGRVALRSFVRRSRVPPRRAGYFLCANKESTQRKSPRFNAPCYARGALRYSKHRVSAQLALATLGARTVLATAELRASEPDAPALLGVSEGERNASTINRCDFSVRENGDGFDFGSRRERRVAERDREEGRGLSELRAQRGRVPQAPGRASNAGESGATRLTANAGSSFLGYFF